MKSSIEWLEERLNVSLGDDIKSLRGFFVIAKEMHKDEIMDAFRYGNSNEILGKKHPEEYYNETFNK